MNFLRKHWPVVVLGVLVFSNIFVWARVSAERGNKILHVYFLDVGQGDAILIDSPDHKQMLIDGGRNRAVLSEIGKILPFGDRSIDMVLATHPDADHIGGLPEVIQNYDVDLFIESGVESDNKIDDELKREVEAKNIQTLIARRGMIINFGDGVRLQILFPNQDVTNWETNRASIVAKLIYGDKSFLLTGDSPIPIENVLLNLDRETLDVDVLKAGHHGSRTSTSLSYAEATSPKYAVISAGKDNSYGHPHKEVLDILEKVGAKIVSTIDSSTIEFETDGKSLILK